jgi:hypothetical protein
MNIRRYIFAFIIALLIGLGLPLSSSGQRRAPASAAATVAAFYKLHLSNNTSFTRENIMRKRRWLAPELYKLMLNEFRREDAWVKENPDQVPYFTGDPFTNSQEHPSSYRTGQAEVTGNNAKVDVTLSWTEGGNTVDTRKITVMLRKHGSKWLISNIVSGEGTNAVTDLKAVLSREKYQP